MNQINSEVKHQLFQEAKWAIRKAQESAYSRDHDEALQNRMNRACINYVKYCLDGHSRKIDFFYFPGRIVVCESVDSNVDCPIHHDLPKYAGIEYKTGKIEWRMYAELLTEEHRSQITRAAMKEFEKSHPQSIGAWSKQTQSESLDIIFTDPIFDDVL